MSQRRRTVWTSCIALPVVAALAWFLLTPEPEAPSRGDSAVHGTVAALDPLIAGVRDGIEAHSGKGGKTALPSAQAPPGFERSVQDFPQEPKRTPLEGYAHTAFAGELRTATMAEAGFGGEADPILAADWLRDGQGVGNLARQAQAAGRDWTFGWLGFEPDADRNEVRAALGALGGEPLGVRSNPMRARLPADRGALEAIARLDGVAGIAATPIDLKLPPALAEVAKSAPAHEMVPVFVTLMAEDPDGRWRRALVAFGGVVGRYDPDIRVVVANVPYGAIEAVAAADFVMAVERIGTVRAAHDTAVPAMGADAIRTFDAVGGVYGGVTGASVPVGVMDSGLNVRHLDIGKGRGSICGANFSTIFEARTQDLDLWIDAGLHGTHVTGTILGSGAGDARYAGMAPGVRDIRFAKVLNDGGFGTLDGVLRGMDFLARPTACSDDEPVRALLVNASLSEAGVDWRGRTTSERKLDAAVWEHRQLYVVANSNAGFQALGNIAAAKNALAVGAAHDGGDIANFSSHGPTGDGRLAPLVVGTGVDVRSARGDGRRTGYIAIDGTSMASPSVAGVAALLMDAVPSYRERPAAVRARLMASAIRPDAFLEDPDLFPPHNGGGPGGLQNRYGLGKVSARTTVLSRDEADGWVTGGAVVAIDDGEYAFHDIVVPPGASRLDVVMTWDEPPADTLVQPVLNDLDLWVDRDADCAPSLPAACGEAASRSMRDNVEWLMLRDPQPGTYRLKVVPKRARADAPRVGLAWTVIRGPSTPQLAISADAASVHAEPGSPFEVGLTVSTDGYVAAGAMLRIDCRAAAGSEVCSRVAVMAPKASTASREDAVLRPLENDTENAIALGEIAVGEAQTVSLVFEGPADPESFRLYFTATAWNARSATASVVVDAGSPGEPPLAAVPRNDDFAAADRLGGASGTRAMDLLLATPEPGEPPAVSSPGAPTERPRSLWYAWTAPRTDTFRFSVDAGGPLGVADDLGMDLFEVAGDEPLAGLRSTEIKVGGGLTFAAVGGRDYRIRVGLFGASSAWRGAGPPEPDAGSPRAREPRRIVEPLTLRWSTAPPPPNDRFDGATAIGGAEGNAAGTNLGASVEPGERVGHLAATTWFRWRAPATGDYAFAVDRRRLAVAAFTGEDVGALRLVSGLPGAEAVFPAREGDDYRIAVAARDAFVSGNDYTLRWGAGARDAVANDDVDSAEWIPGDAPGHRLRADFATATVEPGEPVETGVRTAWWRWTPPRDGVYTWRARRDLASFRMNVFRRDAEAGLARVAGSDADGRAHLEFRWRALAGTIYQVSVGLHTDAAFETPFEDGLTVEWGRSPGNDDIGAAAVLAGGAGSVSGSNSFATVEPGEDAVGLGDASLWWRWEAPEEGWHRFALASAHSGVLAVYRLSPDGGLERVAVSRPLAGRAEATFRTEAGATYLIRLGSARGPGGPFELAWEAHGEPAWLRFVALVEDGDLDDAGTLVQIANVRSMAVDPEGRALYAATADGLQVYARDAGSGRLTLRQTIPGVDNDALLLWDAPSGSLLAASCLGWDRFVPLADGQGLEFAGALAEPTPCPEPGARIHAAGPLLVLVVPSLGLETYRMNEDRTAIERTGAAFFVRSRRRCRVDRRRECLRHGGGRAACPCAGPRDGRAGATGRDPKRRRRRRAAGGGTRGRARARRGRRRRRAVRVRVRRGRGCGVRPDRAGQAPVSRRARAVHGVGDAVRGQCRILLA